MTKPDLSPPDALAALIKQCLAAGASGADAEIARADGVSVDVREGKLEGIERAESSSVALRCFFGQRQAHVSGSDISPAGLNALATRCVAMARVVPEDPFCGLTEAADLAAMPADLDLGGEAEWSAARLEADAREAEAAALAVPGVKTVSGSGASWSRSERWVAASNGFASYKAGNSIGLGLSAIAEANGQMERDFDGWSVRDVSRRPSPEEIGRTAGTRAVARLGARRIETQKAAVMFDRRLSDDLIGEFLSAISGPAVARGVSFLKDRLGAQVFSSDIDIIDDPFRVHGLGNRAHDGEGRAVKRTALIDKGVLTAFLLNGPSARKLGLAPNGFASKGFGGPPGVATSNLHLAPGTQSPKDLMKQAGRGLLVTDMFGPSVNPNTGDFSVGVSGFWFEDGAVAYPVSEVTVAGDLLSMFLRMIAANDLELRSTRDAPSILFEDMSLAGS